MRDASISWANDWLVHQLLHHPSVICSDQSLRQQLIYETYLNYQNNISTIIATDTDTTSTSSSSVIGSKSRRSEDVDIFTSTSTSSDVTSRGNTNSNSHSNHHFTLTSATLCVQFKHMGVVAPCTIEFSIPNATTTDDGFYDNNNQSYSHNNNQRYRQSKVQYEVNIIFREKQKSISPGQIAALYMDSVCVGAGVIYDTSFRAQDYLSLHRNALLKHDTIH